MGRMEARFSTSVGFVPGITESIARAQTDVATTTRMAEGTQRWSNPCEFELRWSVRETSGNRGGEHVRERAMRGNVDLIRRLGDLYVLVYFSRRRCGGARL
jgi:hypothetical protein